MNFVPETLHSAFHMQPQPEVCDNYFRYHMFSAWMLPTEAEICRIQKITNFLNVAGSSFCKAASTYILLAYWKVKLVFIRIFIGGEV